MSAADKPKDPKKPRSTVAIDGGDMWSGVRGVSTEDVRDLAEMAFSTTVARPVLDQWYPRRRWLWQQWRGTIVRVVLFREVLLSMVLALLFALFFNMPGPHAAAREGVVNTLRGVERVWVLISGLVSFSLAFFLSQAYNVWRAVYVRTRVVQGRLNDLGLLCATSAERDADGAYTADAEELLRTLGRYLRVFHVLLYASLTRRFAPLRTPSGLGVLVERQDLVLEERDALLESSLAHNAVFAWISSTIGGALNDGRLDRVYSRTFQDKLLDLRAAYASIGDQLAGRLPLAYTHLMQLLADLLCFTAPVALLPYTAGAWSTVLGSGLVTLFYSSVLNLAKVFLDPLDNDSNAVRTGISIHVPTLLQESNLGSERWRRGAARLPLGARSRARPAQAARAEGAPPAVGVVFELCDGEGRGDLGLAELREALQTLGLAPAETAPAGAAEGDALEALFRSADANANGRIDLHEFQELVAELRAVEHDQAVPAAGVAEAPAAGPLAGPEVELEV